MPVRVTKIRYFLLPTSFDLHDNVLAAFRAADYARSSKNEEMRCRCSETTWGAR